MRKQLVIAAAAAAVLLFLWKKGVLKRLADKLRTVVPTGKAETYVSGPQNYNSHPYVGVQNAIEAVRGDPDAHAILQEGRPALEAVYRSTAMLTPEDLMKAESAAWAAATEADQAAPFNTEKMTNIDEDTMQHFETAPAQDHMTMIQDLVVDPRMRDNQELWAQEMRGWSGTSTIKADTFEPQLYLNWQGLRMPQAGVGQVNPLQLTEVDDSDLAVNRPFKFNG